MVTPKKHYTSGPLPDKNFSSQTKKFAASDRYLLMQRIKELDREFARQTKQLTKLTKEFQKKLKKKLTEKL